MQFESVQAFIHMGGYGFYVWCSFGLTFLSLGWLSLSSVRKGRRILHDVHQQQQREARQQAAQNVESVL